MNDNNGFVVGDHDRHSQSHHSHSPTSISQKLHSSISNMSCCFGPNKHHNHHHHHHHHHQAISPIHVSKSRLLGRSSSAWMKSRSHVHDHDDYVHGGHLPELKGKCRNLISRISRGCHRRHHSADFHYDALSYSRNFDDDETDDTDDAFPFRSFSSRLPQSPPPAKEDDDEKDRVEDEEEEETEPSSTPSSAAEMIIACR
ncbi:uncharacterized protein LOC133784363 [Humulus lupulus]|uniref:uncharacterized protein LOC133784363 n=1 Tax=Humulus lupulus TaxID=3486 RepID=UPI002B4118DF|nr:uncharacterized protein LOC133784363 [Humulus lupulus]